MWSRKKEEAERKKREEAEKKRLEEKAKELAMKKTDAEKFLQQARECYVKGNYEEALALYDKITKDVEQDLDIRLSVLVEVISKCAADSIERFGSSAACLYFAQLINNLAPEQLHKITAQDILRWCDNAALKKLVKNNLFTHKEVFQSWFIGLSLVEGKEMEIPEEKIPQIQVVAQNFMAQFISPESLTRHGDIVEAFLKMLVAYQPAFFTPSIFSVEHLKDERIRMQVKSFIINEKCNWSIDQLWGLLDFLKQASCDQQVMNIFIVDIFKYHVTKITSEFVINLLRSELLPVNYYEDVFALLLKHWGSMQVMDLLLRFCRDPVENKRVAIILNLVTKLNQGLLTAAVISELVSSIKTDVAGLEVAQQIILFLEDGNNWIHWGANAAAECLAVLEWLEQLGNTAAVPVFTEISDDLTDFCSFLLDSLQPKFSLDKVYLAVVKSYLNNDKYLEAAAIIIDKIPADISLQLLISYGIQSVDFSIAKIGLKNFVDIIKNPGLAEWWSGDELKCFVDAVEFPPEQQFFAYTCLQEEHLRNKFTSEQQRSLEAILGRAAVGDPSSSAAVVEDTVSTTVAGGFFVPPPPPPPPCSGSRSLQPPPLADGGSSSGHSPMSAGLLSAIGSFGGVGKLRKTPGSVGTKLPSGSDEGGELSTPSVKV